MKKIISLIIVLSMLLSVNMSAFAISEDTSVSLYNLPSDIALISEGIDLQDNDGEDVVEKISTISELSPANSYMGYQAYSGEQVEDIFKSALPNYQEDLNVTTYEDSSVISYTTTDSKEVYYTYHGNQLYNTCIYDTDTDKLTFIDNNNSTVEVIENFRAPLEDYTISEEEMAEIYSFLEQGNIDAIENMPNIKIEYHGANRIILKEPENSLYASTADNWDYIMDIMEKDFPEYYNRTLYDQYDRSWAISDDVRVKVVSSMYDFVRKSADTRFFAAGTALSLISAFLSLKTIDATVVVLTALSIGVSGVDYILDSTSLCSTVKMSYTYETNGLIWDRLTVNGFVVGRTHTTNAGYITGGYTDNSRNPDYGFVNGDTPSNYLEDDPSGTKTYAALALDKYNQNVYPSGYCSLPEF